jgi:hypothetical protein
MLAFWSVVPFIGDTKDTMGGSVMGVIVKLNMNIEYGFASTKFTKPDPAIEAETSNAASKPTANALFILCSSSS